MKAQKSYRMNPSMKSIVAAIALLFALCSPTLTKHADAQIFIVPEDDYLNNRTGISDGTLVPITPQGLVYDWIDVYTPLGEGWLLLAGLGGAYLLGKQRKRKEE